MLQLDCQKRARGSEHYTRSIISFSPISSGPQNVILKGNGEYKEVSGMAMKNSGEVSDAAFAFLVERWCVNPDTMNAFSIDLYRRFKDDIIIVAKNRMLTKHFVWGMKHRSKYYKIKVEEISDITVQFLEVRVWKHGSRFVTGPEFKPTSLWQPLGADSAHVPHCQMSWPAARLTMSRALSGTPAI